MDKVPSYVFEILHDAELEDHLPLLSVDDIVSLGIDRKWAKKLKDIFGNATQSNDLYTPRENTYGMEKYSPDNDDGWNLEEDEPEEYRRNDSYTPTPRRDTYGNNSFNNELNGNNDGWDLEADEPEEYRRNDSYTPTPRRDTYGNNSFNNELNENNGNNEGWNLEANEPEDNTYNYRAKQTKKKRNSTQPKTTRKNGRNNTTSLNSAKSQLRELDKKIGIGGEGLFIYGEWLKGETPENLISLGIDKSVAVLLIKTAKKEFSRNSNFTPYESANTTYEVSENQGNRTNTSKLTTKNNNRTNTSKPTTKNNNRTNRSNSKKTNEALLTASERGDILGVQEALIQGADKNYKNSSGKTARDIAYSKTPWFGNNEWSEIVAFIDKITPEMIAHSRDESLLYTPSTEDAEDAEMKEKDIQDIKTLTPLLTRPTKPLSDSKSRTVLADIIFVFQQFYNIQARAASRAGGEYSLIYDLHEKQDLETLFKMKALMANGVLTVDDEHITPDPFDDFNFSKEQILKFIPTKHPKHNELEDSRIFSINGHGALTEEGATISNRKTNKVPKDVLIITFSRPGYPTHSRSRMKQLFKYMYETKNYMLQDPIKYYDTLSSSEFFGNEFHLHFTEFNGIKNTSDSIFRDTYSDQSFDTMLTPNEYKLKKETRDKKGKCLLGVKNAVDCNPPIGHKLHNILWGYDLKRVGITNFGSIEGNPLNCTRIEENSYSLRNECFVSKKDFKNIWKNDVWLKPKSIDNIFKSDNSKTIEFLVDQIKENSVYKHFYEPETQLYESSCTLSNVIKHTRKKKYKKGPLIFYFPVCRVDMEDKAYYSEGNEGQNSPDSRVHQIKLFSNFINLGHHLNEDGKLADESKGLKWSSETVSWEGNRVLRNV